MPSSAVIAFLSGGVPFRCKRVEVFVQQGHEGGHWIRRLRLCCGRRDSTREGATSISLSRERAMPTAAQAVPTSAVGLPHTIELRVSADPVRWMLSI